MEEPDVETRLKDSLGDNYDSNVQIVKLIYKHLQDVHQDAQKLESVLADEGDVGSPKVASHLKWANRESNQLQRGKFADK